MVPRDSRVLRKGYVRTPSFILGMVLAGAGPIEAQSDSPTTYQIISRLSQASYAVDEVFLRENNRLFTAVAVTPGVAGEISFDRHRPAGARVVEIVVDLQQLTSDSDRRDRAIRRKYLESDRFPFARLSNAIIQGLPDTIPERTPFRYALVGDLTVHDMTRQTTWEGEASVAGDTLRGVARAKVTMSMFGIEVPRLLSLRAEDDVRLEIRYVAVLRKPQSVNPSSN
jgi:polyisoprenoid-binding protein YceI